VNDEGGRRGRRGDILRICVTCRWRGLEALPGTELRPGRRLYDLVAARAGEELGPAIHPICCLANCFRSCNAVLAGRGKAAVMLSLMAPDEATAEALLDYFARYRASADGAVASGAPELPVVQVLRHAAERASSPEVGA
jgi:predicted metal-binding protein